MDITKVEECLQYISEHGLWEPDNANILAAQDTLRASLLHMRPNSIPLAIVPTGSTYLGWWSHNTPPDYDGRLLYVAHPNDVNINKRHKDAKIKDFSVMGISYSITPVAINELAKTIDKSSRFALLLLSMWDNVALYFKTDSVLDNTPPVSVSNSRLNKPLPNGTKTAHVYPVQPDIITQSIRVLKNKTTTTTEHGDTFTQPPSFTQLPSLEGQSLCHIISPDSVLGDSLHAGALTSHLTKSIYYTPLHHIAHMDYLDLLSFISISHATEKRVREGVAAQIPRNAIPLPITNHQGKEQYEGSRYQVTRAFYSSNMHRRLIEVLDKLQRRGIDFNQLSVLDTNDNFYSTFFDLNIYGTTTVSWAHTKLAQTLLASMDMYLAPVNLLPSLSRKRKNLIQDANNKKPLSNALHSALLLGQIRYILWITRDWGNLTAQKTNEMVNRGWSGVISHIQTLKNSQRLSFIPRILHHAIALGLLNDLLDDICQILYYRDNHGDTNKITELPNDVQQGARRLLAASDDVEQILQTQQDYYFLRLPFYFFSGDYYHEISLGDYHVPFSPFMAFATALQKTIML